VRGVRRPTARVHGWNEENECLRGHGRKAEWIRGGADEDLRGNRPAGVFLVIDERARSHRNVNVESGQMRVQRLTVMMFSFVGVEMHVHQRRANGANLHEDSESGRGQPAKHAAIVVKDGRRRHLTIS